MKTITPGNSAYMDRFLPKYVRLKNQLVDRIQSLDTGERLPSISAIRKKYKVSQPTVDRALQELRVEGMVESIRGKGIFVASGAKMKNIALCFGRDIDRNGVGAFERTLLRSLQGTCRGTRFALRYYMDDPAHDRDEHGPDQLQLDSQSGRVHGVLGADDGDTVWQQNILQLNLPTVVLSDSPIFPCRVTLAPSPIIRLGVESLVRRGCKRIGLFNHSPAVHPGMAMEEQATWAAAIQDFGATTRPEWCYAWNDTSSLELIGYAEFARRWPTWQEKPDAIVCVDDNITSGMLRAASALGVRVPQDLQIASHANRGVSDFGTNNVIKIEFDVDKIASTMVNYLGILISGRMPEPNVLVVQPELVDGDGSTT